MKRTTEDTSHHPKTKSLRQTTEVDLTSLEERAEAPRRDEYDLTPEQRGITHAVATRYA